MTKQISNETIKQWAIDFVAEAHPEDTFVIEEGFDAMLEAWHHADAQDEGRFVGGAEIASFAGLIVPFLAGMFGDVIKDVVKDQAKKAVGKLIDKWTNKEASLEEVKRLDKEINEAINNSQFSEEQKDTLRNNFKEIFSKME